MALHYITHLYDISSYYNLIDITLYYTLA